MCPRHDTRDVSTSAAVILPESTQRRKMRSFALMCRIPLYVARRTTFPFALDNLWDGLGALTVVMPNVKYFFGKVTMYPSYHRRGRDMILYFLKKHFYDKYELVTPMEPLKSETSEEELKALFCKDTFKEDYKILNCEIRKLGYNIPPLVNAYMSLSPTMRMFGTAINYEFGDVEETGILIAVDEILEDKRMRHIQTFIESHPDAMKMPCDNDEAFAPKVVTPQADCCR